MSRKLVSTIVSIVASAALIPGAAAAQDSSQVDSIQIKSVTAYVDSPMRPRNTQSIVVWFRMAAPLPNRVTSVDGGGQQSVASKGSRCFQMIAGTKGKKLGPRGRIAKVGSKHTLKVSTSAGSDRVSDTITFTIRKGGKDHRANRAAARKRVGC